MVKSFKYLLAFLLLPAYQGLTAGTIGFSIHDSTVVQGNTISFPIYADSSLTGQNVTAFQLQISYNTNIFAADTIVTAGTMSQAFGSISVNMSVPGKITIAAAGTAPLSGKGILLYIRLKAVGSGYSNLSFTDAAHNFLNEGSPPVTWDNGYIYTQPAPTITVYPSSGNITVGDSLHFTVSGGTAPYTWSVTNGGVATINSSAWLKGTHAGFTKVVAEDSHGTVDTTDNLIEIRAFKLTVRDTSYMQGQTFDLPVYVSDLTSLGVTSGSFDLTFNQNLLSVQGVVQTGTLLSSYSPPAVNSSVSGKVSISFAGASALSGSGVLLFVRFKVSSTSGGSTAISPANALFNETMPGNSKNGYFSTINLATLYISPNTANVVAGNTLSFTASGGTPPYSWSTTDPSLATISSSGVLTAVKGGTVNVKAMDVYGGSGTSGSIQIYDTKVTIPDTIGVIGDTIDVPVYMSPVDPGNPVSSLQATIGYDSSVVHLVEIVDSGTLTEGWSFVPNVTGTKITFAAAGATPITTPGIVCVLRLRVPPWVNTSRTSSLTMQQFLLNEGSPRPLLDNGGVTSSNVPLPLVPALSSPGDGATGVSTSPSLSWNSSSGAVSYRVQVSTDSTFATILYNYGGIAATSRSFSGLAYLTKYFWRVNASNSAGTSDWSAVWKFTTVISPPPAPVPNFPANGATGVAVNPAISWNSAAGAASYRLQVSTSASFGTTILDSSGIAATSVNMSGLGHATLYYWRVNAVSAGGTGPWSAVWHFTTVVAPPAAPALSVPANGATGVSVDPTLTWSSSSGAADYQLQVSTDSTFAAVGLDSTGIAATSAIVHGLLHGARYHWRVRASNAGGTGAWSTVWSFTTTVAPPAAPALSAPANDTTGTSVDPVLAWSSAAGAVTYQLQVGTDSTFALTSLDSTGIAGVSVTLHGMLHATKYFWRVRASNAGGSGPWSAVWKFTTIVAVPAPPTGMSAASAGFFGMTLGWTDNSTNESGFKIERTPDSSGSWGMIGTLVPNSTSYADTGLVDGSRYFYRVYAFNAGGNSGYSNVAVGVTDMRPPTGLGLAQNPGPKIVLTWQDSSGSEDVFRIERKTGSGGTYAQIDSVGANVTTFTDSTVAAGQHYFYRVRGRNSYATSSYSNEANLLVTTVVGDHSAIPDKYGISQNYPNPFNPTTAIEFQLPEAAYVELRVYDVMGRLVRTLVSGNRSAGYYRVTFDGSGLSSGIYFFRLSAGKFTQLHKMVLMK